MIKVHPVTLEGYGVRLEPLAREHRDGLVAAAADGRLWELSFTSVPEPEETQAYIFHALTGQAEGHVLPWAVRGADERHHHWQHALSRHRVRNRSRRDRLHVVRKALATQPRQHRL